MPYEHAAVQASLGSIQAISPDIELVRSEILPVNGGMPQQQFTLVSATGRLEVRVPHSGELSREDGARINAFLKIDRTAAEALTAQLCALHALNHYGTWIVQPATAPDLIMGGTGPNLLDGKSSLLSDVHASLYDALPGVHEIRIETIIHKKSNGHLRRQACVRILASDSIELAAIDASLFPAHLQALLLPREFSKAHQLRRAGAWASQLAVDLDMLPGILDDLGLLAVSLPLTRVVLHAPAETQAYWQNRTVKGRQQAARQAASKTA